MFEPQLVKSHVRGKKRGREGKRGGGIWVISELNKDKDGGGEIMRPIPMFTFQVNNK